jgi:hypothetical protein
MSEGVCAFVIAITSVVQRRERERERETWRGREGSETNYGWNSLE